MTAPTYWKEATAALGASDGVLKELISSCEGLALGSRGDAFSTLARAIVGQQISVKAAQTVWDRLSYRLGHVSPEPLLLVRSRTLRICGLSGQKSGYLKDLARKFLDGELDPLRWATLEDEALIAELTQVKGIGRWTAEMFLIFYLTRPDVLPVADIGLQRAMSRHYNRGRPVSLARMHRIGKPWAPWRSVATWYLWRSLDPLPVEY
jgi:DNA-3-methyladenine glycosylase II